MSDPAPPVAEPSAGRALLLTRGLVVTLDDQHRVVPDGAVLVVDGKVAAVGPSSELEAGTDHGVPRLDLDGAAVAPGLVNTHVHLYANLVKGASPSHDFAAWMADTIGPAADLLTEDDCVCAAVAGALEAVRTGTTTLVEFSSVLPTDRTASRIIDAVRSVGLRVVFARGMRDIAGDGFSTRGSRSAAEVIAEVDELARRHRDDPLVRTGFAPTALWAGVSDAGLQELAEHASRTGSLLTMHLAEVGADDQVASARSGRSPVAHLGSLGVLGPWFMAVHGNRMSPDDLELLAEHGASLSHNPGSNLYFGHPTAPVARARALGIPVGLATDSAASNNSLDLFEEVKLAALLHAGADPQGLTAADVLTLATSGGARAVDGTPGPTGIAPGADADLVVIDLDDPKARPVRDVHRTLALSVGSSSVRTVIVGGSVVVDEGRSLVVDEAEVLAEVQARSDDLAARMGTLD